MVVLDTCRPDHLGCYGYSRETSPNIDNFSKDCVIFNNAFAQSNMTLPSFASFLTSKYLSSTGVYWTRPPTKRLNNMELTLPEVLRIYRYKTIAFPTGTQMDPVFGLNQGFDIYTNTPFDVSNTPKRVDYKLAWSFNDYLPNALEWLEAHKSEKFFMLLQSNDMHPPYDYPLAYRAVFSPHYQGILNIFEMNSKVLSSISGEKLSVKWLKTGRDFMGALPFPPEQEEIILGKNDIDYIIGRYDSGIFFADKCVGEILKKLDDLQLNKKTIVIILSDHGEELHERGTFDRANRDRLYNELLKVVLMIRHPELKARKISSPVQLIDLMPTIFDWLKIPIPEEAQGISLAKLSEGKAPKSLNEYIYSETKDGRMAIQTKKWKLIKGYGEDELYNLETDPGETKNIAKANPAVAGNLTDILFRWYKNNLPKQPPDIYLEKESPVKYKD